jgi:hypothetical protein
VLPARKAVTSESLSGLPRGKSRAPSGPASAPALLICILRRAKIRNVTKPLREIESIPMKLAGFAGLPTMSRQICFAFIPCRRREDNQ